ncbi:MAG: hypothetical protein R3B48_19665 [Kofleriaceae bacterium]
MGLVTTLLTALGCAPASKRPTLSDFEVSLSPKRALQRDPEIAKNGRYEVVAGEKIVLEFNVLSGKSAIAYDQEAFWSAVVELPPGTDVQKPVQVSLEGLPAVARVAGEDVLFLAQQGKGTLKLEGGGGASIRGEVDAVFTPADRDLIKLGAFKLSGAFKATVKP